MRALHWELTYYQALGRCQRAALFSPQEQRVCVVVCFITCHNSVFTLKRVYQYSIPFYCHCICELCTYIYYICYSQAINFTTPSLSACVCCVYITLVVLYSWHCSCGVHVGLCIGGFVLGGLEPEGGHQQEPKALWRKGWSRGKLVCAVPKLYQPSQSTRKPSLR